MLLKRKELISRNIFQWERISRFFTLWSGNLQSLSHHILQNFREINFLAKKLNCKLVSRKKLIECEMCCSLRLFSRIISYLNERKIYVFWMYVYYKLIWRKKIAKARCGSVQLTVWKKRKIHCIVKLYSKRLISQNFCDKIRALSVQFHNFRNMELDHTNTFLLFQL